MHKDQYTDAPSQEQVRVKTMLNSTISMGYPDVVIACIEHQVSLILPSNSGHTAK